MGMDHRNYDPEYLGDTCMDCGREDTELYARYDGDALVDVCIDAGDCRAFRRERARRRVGAEQRYRAVQAVEQGLVQP